MDEIDRLTAIEEIKQLKARYFRFMDTKRWDDFAALFADEATMDMRAEVVSLASVGLKLEFGDLVWSGPRDIAAKVAAALEITRSVHHGHTPEITIESPVSATGIWAMEDLIFYPPGSPFPGFQAYGHYHDRYVIQHGGWRIASTTLSRLQRVLLPGQGPQHIINPAIGSALRE